MNGASVGIAWRKRPSTILWMLSIGQLERIVDGNDAKALSPNEVEHFIRTAFDRKAAGWRRVSS